MKLARFASIACAALLAACVPELDDRAFLVDGPRLLAIASEPAEAKPPAEVALRALYVDPSGDRSADLEWAFCIARKTFTDEGTVSPSCLALSGDGLVPIGSGASATGAIPMDACRLFGPDPPDAVDGQPAGRPVDPDETGGFYQPVRLRIRDGSDAYAIGSTRIACGVSGATGEVSADFETRHLANVNPAIASLTLVHEDAATPDDHLVADAPGAASSAHVKAGEHAKLVAAWDACPTMGVGCTGAEQYVAFDVSTRALDVRREAIRISWFATAGTLADDGSGRTESEIDGGATDLTNAWTAPNRQGDTRLWLVVRDDRGGVGWGSYRVSVE